MAIQADTATCQHALSPAQQQVIDGGLLTSGFNCILQMPTGSGKTWLAEQAIAHALNHNHRAIYLTPLRALANELKTRWEDRFAPKGVGVFTGDYAHHAYPVPYADAQLLVMTPEKLDACLRNWRSHWHWLPQVNLVVVDELHLLGDPKRGARLEGTLLRLMRLNPFTRILGLSATLGNRQELADWLNGVDYYSAWRPVPLDWRVVRYKRAQDKPNLLLQEVQPIVAAGGKSLVFVQSRRRAESLAIGLREAGLKAAHHHAGLGQSDRHQVEAQFRHAGLDVLVATATLEMGLNLPARQVILYDLQGFDGVDFSPLPVNNVWQRAGRAGRPGLDQVGEVVLLAPTWERGADSYAQGRFEPIRSGLSQPAMVAEQIIAEVASGLSRSPNQLETVFQQTLASHQNILPDVAQVLTDMVEAGMVMEREGEDEYPLLKATHLGYVAVRHLLTPQTVLLFKRLFESEADLTFLDLLILAASSEDCQPLIPVDFEQLEELAVALAAEPSGFLSESSADLGDRLGASGKRLLAILHTALIARMWTRLGDAQQVAEVMGCYASEVTSLRESLVRLLTAMGAIATVLDSEASPGIQAGLNGADYVGLLERVRGLTNMVSSGLDEEAVTLTLVPGIGAKLAHQLKRAGVGDIEDLALTDVEELVALPRVGKKRAIAWVEAAADMVDGDRSAYRYREETRTNQLTLTHWPQDIDPYRLRRALDLTVVEQNSNENGITYQVTGGLDPHQVEVRGEQMYCDCPDFARGNRCKHQLAVSLFRGDDTMRELARSLTEQPETFQLDLFHLWMGGKA